MIFGLVLVTSIWTQAQAGDVLIEWAGQSDANTVTIHVRVPRGQEISAATLTSADTEILLEAEPAPLRTTTWVVIDASETMLNFQSTVQTSLQRWLGSPATLRDSEVGLIAYSDEVQAVPPTRIQSQLDAFLSDYTATADTVGCLGDALRTITQRERETNRAWRVLVITAEWSRQTPCIQRTLPQDLPTAIEMVVLANEADDALIELAERGGTEPAFANVRLLDTRLNEIQAAWDDPTFRLDGTLSEALSSSAILTLTLNNGEQITERVQFGSFSAAPTPIVADTSTPLPTIPPATTIVPTQPPTSTATSVPPTQTQMTPSPPPSSTYTSTPADDTPVPDETTRTSQPPTAIVILPTSTVLSPTPSPEITDVVAALPTDTTNTDNPSPAIAPILPSGSENNLTLLLLIGGTLLIIGIGFVLLAISRLGEAPKPESDPPKDDNGSFYDTLDKQTESLRTPVIEVNPAKASRVVNEIDQLLTRMEDVDVIEEANANLAEQTGFVNLDTDMLEQLKTMSDPNNPENSHKEPKALITQVLSDEQFRAMMNKSQDDGEVIAWLQVISGDKDNTHELTRRGVVVGRSRDCDIQIVGDSAISRQHAQFDVSDTLQVTVSRLSANNPVVVGGLQVSNRHPLQPSDVVYLSDKTYIVFILNEEQDDDTLTLI